MSTSSAVQHQKETLNLLSKAANNKQTNMNKPDLFRKKSVESPEKQEQESSDEAITKDRSESESEKDEEVKSEQDDEEEEEKV